MTMDSIEKIVYAFDHDLPVRIEFKDGTVGPHEKIVAFNAEDFTMVLSQEHAKQEEMEPRDKLGCDWDFVKSVELLHEND